MVPSGGELSDTAAGPSQPEGGFPVDDYFLLLKVPRAFALDSALLESRFLEASAKVHPDLAAVDVDSQLRAAEMSAALNRAHGVLADPESRGNHLLQLLGGPSSRQDPSLPRGLLEQVIELRERLSAATDAQAATEVEATARTLREGCLRELEALFGQLGGSVPQAALLAAARCQLNALRFYQRVIGEAHPERRPSGGGRAVR